MVFWNAGRLAQDLRTKGLEEVEKLKYLLAWTVLCGIGNIASSFGGGETDPFQFESTLPYVIDGIAETLVVGVWIFGVIACYKINSAGDNRNFLCRFVTLAWPIAIRMIVICIGLFVLFLIGLGVMAVSYNLDEAFFGTFTKQHIVRITLFGGVLQLLLWIIFYRWLGSYIKHVSHFPAPDPTETAAV